MTKSKVGAEPKKRIKHLFYEREGIHEGIHRDEPGWFKSKCNPYCFGYGYFFQRGETLGKKLTPDYIKDNWDTEMWCRGIKESCIAIVDRNHKIAVVNTTKQRCWDVLYSIPADYKVYRVNETIEYYDILNPRRHKELVKANLRYLINEYIQYYSSYYKVLNSISKYINKYNYTEDAYYVRMRDITRKEILDIVAANKWLPKCKRLSSKPIYVNDKYKVDFPSLNDIVQQTLFTEEQRLKIIKCIFYSKYCYKRDISWKELEKNWSDDWKEKTIKANKDADDRFLKVAAQYKALNKKRKAEAEELLNSDKLINDWREGKVNDNITWVEYYINYEDRRVRPITHTMYNRFNNTQLRLKPGRPNWVETSRGAIVPLEAAIILFNRLYTDYIISGKTHFHFIDDEFKVGSFTLTDMNYTKKYKDSDYAHLRLSEPEWMFQIGCHTLWFDDIKNFAKYYHLEDKLSFPLDKTTAECMRNHLIHLPSGKTIEAIGTSGVLDR